MEDWGAGPLEDEALEASGLQFAAELEAAIAARGSLPSELHYQQVRHALRSLLDQLDLQPQEQTALATEVAALEQVWQKLETAVIQIAVFGLVGRGKSSLLNALLGEPVFATGPLHGVTQTQQTAAWTAAIAPTTTPAWPDPQRVSLPSSGQSRIELIDTPGLDEVAAAARSHLAHTVASQADLVLFVVSGDLTRLEDTALTTLRQSGKPVILVLNKMDQYTEADRHAIYTALCDRYVATGLDPADIVMTAAAPMTVLATRQPNGQLITQHQPGASQVETLRQRILAVLHREGKSLVALNSILYADRLNDHLIAQKMAYREQAANDVIWRAVMTKAMAIALNPVTAVDLLSGAIIDVTLLLTLSQLYGLPLTRKDAIQLLQKIAWGIGGIGAGERLATLGLSSLKGLLGVATVTTGGFAIAPYLAVAMTQGAIGGLASYGIGQVAKVYLANGAAWGSAGPKAVVRQILDSLDEASILQRIKAELRAKLGHSGNEPKPPYGDDESSTAGS